MPGPEFEKLLELCSKWTNDDAEYIFDCSLKDDAPDDVKKAFEKLKKRGCKLNCVTIHPQ